MVYSLNNISHERPTIPPISKEISRPLWSVMIPTYNCASYLRETLASVLAQHPDPQLMQIEVVDDFSTKDDPESIVREVGGGRVNFYRQPRNVGHTRNFETCLKRAKGRLIHLLHGDDCVRNGFYRKMQSAFENNPEIGAAFCRHIFINEQGHWKTVSSLEQTESGILHNWLQKMAVQQIIQTPSMVVRREVYEQLGGFDHRLSFAEDWEMWVRIAASYPIWYEVEPLALYRVHAKSNTGKNIRNGENLRDIRRCIEIIKHYLPVKEVAQLENKARENWAIYGIKYISPQLLSEGDLISTAIQLQEAFKCSYNFSVIKEIPGFAMTSTKKIAKNILRKVPFVSLSN